MAARETLVTLRLPWTDHIEYHGSKKEARLEADRLATAWSKGGMGPFEVVEDGDGDFAVQRVNHA